MPYSGMSFIHNRITGQVREVAKDGKKFLVAPVVAMVEGVYRDEFVPAYEITKHVQAWNGRPFIIDHVFDDRGVPISANDPEILERRKVGTLYNFEGTENKLKGEVWVDIDRAEKIEGGQQVIDRLRSNKPLEVSTGYLRDREEKTGSYDGQSYDGITHNLKPDHLAAILEGQGICSWHDGCGIPRANSTEAQDSADEGEEGSDVKFNVEVPDGADVDEESLAERIVGEFKSLFNIQTNREEDCCMKKIDFILENGDLAFNREDLEAMSEEQIDSLHSTVETRMELETNAEEEEEEDEDVQAQEDEPDLEGEDDGTPVMDAEMLKSTFKSVLDTEFEPVGGISGMVEAVQGLQTNSEKEKENLVKKLIANKRCPLGRDALETMGLSALEALDKSYMPSSFEGLSPDEFVDNEDELVAFSAPSIVEEE